MQIQHNVSLADHSTMRLGGPAAHLAIVTDQMDVAAAMDWARAQQVPVLMIGDGSNIVWRDEGYPGLVLVNQIERYESYPEDETNVYVTVGGGEHWDTVVERTAQAGLTGIEALSLIPGTAGATPVQNVGAYGQEIAQTLVSVEAFDTQTNSFVTIPAQDCGFSYRGSRFKTTDRGRFFITALTLHLVKGNPQPPFYGSVQDYFTEHMIKPAEVTPLVLRQAVMAIRQSKLPDPAKVANNGSFFANPIVSNAELVRIRAGYPEAPAWTVDATTAKLPAAWLIEQAGFKDFHDQATGMSTWPFQPLVLVNEHATSTADLLKFKHQIVEAVQTKFGVTLEQEPELLP
ncbi:MAG TPA: UDP-N-acetylmuramate dehydrogenase [Candidatus Saccharimonadales bacterium]|nr:UDP-N-acetylmuramate dehydrogenase [Candidatus Saccharimonadales bacterium]